MKPITCELYILRPLGGFNLFISHLLHHTEDADAEVTGGVDAEHNVTGRNEETGSIEEAVEGETQLESATLVSTPADVPLTMSKSTGDLPRTPQSFTQCRRTLSMTLNLLLWGVMMQKWGQAMRYSS